ncbi:beta-1,3-galactosyltransferase 5-like [Babylonia areolata]|uniref:beta-1,3-galactosyltransferase 5-like n=1 Tax=Babylonia areolata TaxID=304850 RepID=UPI003FD22224
MNHMLGVCETGHWRSGKVVVNVLHKLTASYQWLCWRKIYAVFRKRRRLQTYVVLTLLAILLLVLANLKTKEKCLSYVDRREVFRNCSGCFRHAHPPALINHPDICAPTSPNQTIDVVFVIFTKVGDGDRRNLIRRTWASVTRNNTSNFRHLFLLGFVPDFRMMAAVSRESGTHRDVVVTDFRDSYLNLTRKSMSSLHWVSTYCGHARFFQKVDDDVFVNTRAILPILNKYAAYLQTGVGGHRRDNATVDRFIANKWYASCKSYPAELYPDYAHGPTYVSSLRVAKRLSQACKDMPFFHIEDAFLGLCQEMIGLSVVHMEELRLFKNVGKLCEAKDLHRGVVYPVRSSVIMEAFWRTLPCPPVVD